MVILSREMKNVMTSNPDADWNESLGLTTNSVEYVCNYASRKLANCFFFSYRITYFDMEMNIRDYRYAIRYWKEVNNIKAHFLAIPNPSRTPLGILLIIHVFMYKNPFFLYTDYLPLSPIFVPCETFPRREDLFLHKLSKRTKAISSNLDLVCKFEPMMQFLHQLRIRIY